MKAPKPFPWPAGKRAAVSLSWDDARPSQVDRGVPILDRYGIKGTFYALPGRVEERLEAWRRAAAAGHEIGNHTILHPCGANFAWLKDENMLENYTLGRLERELLEANRRLRSLLGVSPVTYAYCCGQSFVGRGPGVKSYVPVVARHFLVGRGYLGQNYNIPRRCDLAQAAAIGLDNLAFAQVRPLIEAAVAAGGWLVFAGHDVGNPEAKLNTREATLRQLCRHLKGRPEIWVDTVAAVGRHIAGWQQGRPHAPAQHG